VRVSFIKISISNSVNTSEIVTNLILKCVTLCIFVVLCCICLKDATVEPETV
jgi:hypothetical protein